MCAYRYDKGKIMTDRELLELAAQAAGIEGKWGEIIKNGEDEIDCSDMFFIEDSEYGSIWDPLLDDGDALRLAVKLSIDICFGANYVIARGSVQMPLVNNANDPYAATRRAIVRAAAEIGKGMQ